MREIVGALLWLMVLSPSAKAESRETLELYQELGIDPGVSEEPCTDIDLRGEQLGPIRNQGQASDCFLEAALDLIHYKTGLEISVPDAYLQYSTRFAKESKLSELDTLDRGGHANTFLRMARNLKLCTTESFPNSFVIHRDGAPEWFTRKVDYAEANDYLRTLKQKIERKESIAETTYVKFPGVGRDEVTDLLRVKTVHETWMEIINRSCGSQRVKLPRYRVFPRTLIPFPSELVFQPFQGAIMRALDRNLTLRNPVEISYDAQVINPSRIKPRSYHASVVVGRKWNAQSRSCEYLIRNSWGSGCYGYSSDVRCEGGYFWLNAGDLSSTVYAIAYIQD